MRKFLENDLYLGFACIITHGVMLLVLMLIADTHPLTETRELFRFLSGIWASFGSLATILLAFNIGE